MLVRMARLSDDNKLTARTAPQVTGAARTLLLRFQEMGFKFKTTPNGRRLVIGMEGLVGAAMLEFLSRSELEQYDVVRRRLPEIEAMLGVTDTPTPPPYSPPISLHDIGRRQAIPAPKPKPASKKRKA